MSLPESPASGSTIGVAQTLPAVDLALLASALVAAFAPEHSPDQRPALDVLDYHSDPDGHQYLILRTQPVLKRLLDRLKSLPYRALQSKAADQGFLRPVEWPPFYRKVWLGGHIVEGSELNLTHSIQALIALIDQAIAELVQTHHLNLRDWIIAPTRDSWTRFGRQFGSYWSDFDQTSTRIVPIELTTWSSGAEKTIPLARLITALETVPGHASDHQRCFIEAALKTLKAPPYYEEERQLAQIQQDMQQRLRDPQQQLSRFMAFLTDEGLANLRIQITFQLMKALALNPTQPQTQDPTEISESQKDQEALSHYVQRVLALYFDEYSSLSDEDSTGWEVQLEQDYPHGGRFNLLDQLRKAGFYKVLPVWCEWSAQLFEGPSKAGMNQEAGWCREISYRFRLNGNHPETGKSAFESRIERLRDQLFPNTGEPIGDVSHSIAQVLFLVAVLSPQKLPSGDVPKRVRNWLKKVIKEVNEQGKAGLQRALDYLESRCQQNPPSPPFSKGGVHKSPRPPGNPPWQKGGSKGGFPLDHPLSEDKPLDRLDRITRALRDRLRKSQPVMASHQPMVYYLNVLPDLVYWDRLANGQESILKAGTSPSDEKRAFFQHLPLTQNTPLPGALFSLPVTVQLSEYAVRPVAPAADLEVNVRRERPDRLVQVVWQADRIVRRDLKDYGSLKSLAEWTLPASIVACYPWSAGKKDQAPQTATESGHRTVLHARPAEKEDQALPTDTESWPKEAINRTAFALLSQLLLARLLRAIDAAQQPDVAQRLNTATDSATDPSDEATMNAHPPLTVCSLRLDPEGRPPDPKSHPPDPKGRPSDPKGRLPDPKGRLPDQNGQPEAYSTAQEALYAACHAVDLALNPQVLLHGQGIIPSSLNGLPFRKKNTFAALCSHFPLWMAASNPQLDRIGVVVFTTRPSTLHPLRQQPDQEGALLLMRSYQLRRTQSPSGYRLTLERTRTANVAGGLHVHRPAPVLEEISRLYQQGCQHILCVVQAFRERHLNHAARWLGEGAYTLGPSAFLSEVVNAYPDLRVYPLLRDVFLATRLRERLKDTQTFEVQHTSDYRAGDFSSDHPLRTEVLPIYSLATLRVVGDDHDYEKRSQSGFTTYFLLKLRDVPLDYNHRLSAHLVVPESTYRADLIGALRAVHYLEAQQAPQKGGQKSYFAPVLDPFDWMAPTHQRKVGELTLSPPSATTSQRQRVGTVQLNLTALLSRVADIERSVR